MSIIDQQDWTKIYVARGDQGEYPASHEGCTRLVLLDEDGRDTVADLIAAMVASQAEVWEITDAALIVRGALALRAEHDALVRNRGWVVCGATIDRGAAGPYGGEPRSAEDLMYALECFWEDSARSVAARAMGVK